MTEIIDTIGMPHQTHELLIIKGASLDATIHALHLHPFLVLAIDLLDDLRSDFIGNVDAAVMR
jgi:hypothetical protein